MGNKLDVLFPHSALLLGGPVSAQILPEITHNVPQVHPSSSPHKINFNQQGVKKKIIEFS